MCKRLAANVARARTDPGLWRVGGDVYIGALVIYNAGSLRTDDAWWREWSGNVASYQRAIAYAKSTVALVA